MSSKIDKNAIRARRHKRVRAKISGTAEMPRLCVYRSTKHIYAQVIDDQQGCTLAACSTLEKELASELAGKTKKEQAKIIGETVAKKALGKGIENVVFDRGGYLYTGRVQEVAEGARAAGLKF